MSALSNTTILTGSANAWGGATTVGNGTTAATLQIGNGTNSGSLPATQGVTVNALATLAFSPGSSGITYGGLIQGGGAVAVTGTSASTHTAYLTNATNSFSGGVNITGATLKIDVDGDLGNSANGITFASAGALTLSQTSGSFNLVRNITLTSGGGGGGINVPTGVTVNYAGPGVIAGTGATDPFIVTGGGTLVVSTVNTYNGPTDIGNANATNKPTLQIAADSALGMPPNSATPDTVVLSSGTLSTTASFSINANRGLALNTTGGTITVAGGTALTYNGILADVTTAAAGTALTVNGPGTLFLGSNNNSYGASGNNNSTIIAAGSTLAINGDLNLGVVPAAVEAKSIAINGGTLIGTTSFTIAANRGVTVGTGGATIAANEGQTLTVGGIVAASTALTIAGGGTVALPAANTITGTLTVSGGTTAQFSGPPGTDPSITVATGSALSFTSSAAGQLKINTLSGTGLIVLNLTAPNVNLTNFEIDGAGTMSTVISGSITSLMQYSGAVSHIIRTQTTYTGPTNVNNGTVAGSDTVLGVNNGMPITTALSMGYNNNGSAAAPVLFDLAGFNQQVASLAENPVSLDITGKAMFVKITNSASYLSTLTISGGSGNFGPAIIAAATGGAAIADGTTGRIALTVGSGNLPTMETLSA